MKHVLSSPAGKEGFPLRYTCGDKVTDIQNSENKESWTLSIQICQRILVILWVDRVLESKRKIVVMGTQPWICEIYLSFLNKSFKS